MCGGPCRKSGKFSVAYMAQGGEKEYYAASACEEVYVPPSGNLSLRGLAVAGALELIVYMLPGPHWRLVSLLECSFQPSILQPLHTRVL